MSAPEIPPSTRRALPAGDGRRHALSVREPIRVHAPTTTGEAHLWQYWRIVLRHRWLVLAFLLTTVAATAGWTFTTKPVFTATALLKIEKDEPQVVKFDDVLKMDPTADYYQTLYQLLQSRSLASGVISRLRLDEHPEFRNPERGWLEAVQRWIHHQLNRLSPAPPAVEPAGSGPDVASMSPVTGRFLAKLSVQPVRNSRLVRVAFESHHPDLAARVVNEIADTFVEQQHREKTEATRYATDFLSKQLDSAGSRLKHAETRVSEFLKVNNIVLLAGDGRLGEHQDLITQQLARLSDALLKARGERIAKESLYAQAVGPGDSVPAVLASPLVGRLKEELARFQAEYEKLGQTFKPEYPRMEQLHRSILELRNQLGAEIRRIQDGVEAEYRAAVLTERELQQSVDTHQALARKLGDQMPQYSVLRRDVDTARQLYIALLTRLKETQVASSLITSNISLVDPGEIPLSPSKPRKSRNLLLGVLVGLCGGVALAFLVEYLDQTVKDADDVESVLHLPALGVVPRASIGADRLGSTAVTARGTGGRWLSLPGRAEREQMFADAFRTLRTAMLYGSPDPMPQTFMVTSQQRGEGKTTIASNLASALAQQGPDEVLIVDADLRCPMLHDVFGVRRAPGFANVLAGESGPADVIIRTDAPNLSVMPAGRNAAPLADLLGSPRLGATIEMLAARFKYIVFDTTPLFGTSDAFSLAPHVGGVVLVLRHGHAHRDAARRAAHVLASVGTPLLGVILNQFDPRTAGTGYHAYGDARYVGVDADEADAWPDTVRRGE
jgi:polysaccharide biosynthesis transport protein